MCVSTKKIKLVFLIIGYFILSITASLYADSYDNEHTLIGLVGLWIGVQYAALFLPQMYGLPFLFLNLTVLMFVFSYIVHKNWLTLSMSLLGFAIWVYLGSISILSTI